MYSLRPRALPMTNAERQAKWRAKKLAKDGETFRKKEAERIRGYYTKVEDMTVAQRTVFRTNTRHRVQRHRAKKRAAAAAGQTSDEDDDDDDELGDSDEDDDDDGDDGGDEVEVYSSEEEDGEPTVVFSRRRSGTQGMYQLMSRVNYRTFIHICLSAFVPACIHLKMFDGCLYSPEKSLLSLISSVILLPLSFN